MTDTHAASRRPIGIAPETASSPLMVVCDDGSVWKWEHERNGWEEMTPVPGSIRAHHTDA